MKMFVRKPKTDETERNKADVACQDILDAANGYLDRSPYAAPRTLKRKGGMSEAVCIARRKVLVSNETLIAAGFKPSKALQ